MTDQARRLLQQNMAEHVNCRCATVPYVADKDVKWGSQRQNLFWTQRLNRMRYER